MEPLYLLIWAVVLLTPPTIVLAWYVANQQQRKKRLHELEQLWGWLGSGARQYGSGREWVGEVDGRRVDVGWMDRNTTVRVEAQPKVRAGFGRGDQPAALVPESQDGTQAIQLDGDKVGWTTRSEDIHALVEQPQVKAALDTLLERDGASLRSVDIDPRTGVAFFARNLPHHIGREDTERWVRAVIAIAKGAEGSR